MAQHNPQSREYLFILLAAIVVCFLLAQVILGHGYSETHEAAHDGAPAAHMTETPSEGEAKPHSGDGHSTGAEESAEKPEADAH